MLKQTFDAAIRTSPAARRALINLLYRMLTRLDRDAEMVFMNYGYASRNGDGHLELRPHDERDRYCIQLYHHLARQVSLRGKDVLEVGSGRGGGASYLARYLEPRTLVGVDRCAEAVRFCSRHHEAPALSFRVGDAEALPFAGDSFDVVINVESSHCYGSLARFLAEVKRVLRPGGTFLYTDHRGPHQMDHWRGELHRSGLEIVRESDISANVVEALDRSDGSKRALIDRRCPDWLRRPIKEFAAVQGSAAYERFLTGNTRYLSFVLRKPA
jgi:SAM-dependent methyltransferase